MNKEDPCYHLIARIILDFFCWTIIQFFRQSGGNGFDCGITNKYSFNAFNALVADFFSEQDRFAHILNFLQGVVGIDIHRMFGNLDFLFFVSGIDCDHVVHIIGFDGSFCAKNHGFHGIFIDISQ